MNSLLFTVLLALLLCLTGCMSQTDSGESVSASTAETPETIETEAPAETKTLIRLKGRSASCEGEGVSISGSEIMMARTIEVIENAGVRNCIRIILGGNCIDERGALMIGADAYSRDILDCVRHCRRFVLGEE